MKGLIGAGKQVLDVTVRLCREEQELYGMLGGKVLNLLPTLDRDPGAILSLRMRDIFFPELILGVLPAFNPGNR